MKNKFLLLLCFVSLFGCVKKEGLKPQEEDFSHLKIQTVLSQADEKYFKIVGQQINRIGKSFATGVFPVSSEETCKELKIMFEEISKRPISREREKNRERERLMLKSFCSSPPEEEFTLHELLYLTDLLPTTARFKVLLVPYIFSYPSDFIPLEYYPNQTLINWIYESAMRSDPQDLISYFYFENWLRFKDQFALISNPAVQQEYCRKAVELRQWDHIAYLTEADSPENYLECLIPEDLHAGDCKCAEATKLVLKEISKTGLYNPSFYNPSGDEMNTVVLNQYRRELRDAMKKVIGRDLDKEPKVSYFKGDPGV
jgi:hypothetical protein